MAKRSCKRQLGRRVAEEQSEEPLVASCGLAKTAALTMLRRRGDPDGRVGKLVPLRR